MFILIKRLYNRAWRWKNAKTSENYLSMFLEKVDVNVEFVNRFSECE